MGEFGELDELKKKVYHLEYDEINPLKEDINEMKITLSNNDLLTKQALDSNERLSRAIDVLKTTMVDVSQSVKDSNRINGEITKTIEELNKKITSVEVKTTENLEKFGKKIDEIDNKSKLDITLWMKNNWFGIVGILGILYTVIKAMM